ncbi:MAG: SpoIVB peptidase [Firmicutes bacterium]|nr:SpoIVB peptidase [Bacillota bacterium]MBQ6686429.1 SpoIVB peptidase [Bacillota bacterium]
MDRKTIRLRVRGFLTGFGLFLLGLTLGSVIPYSTIPDNIQVFSDETHTLDLPMKEVKISVLPEKTLVPGGHSVGIRMDVSGVLIVGLEEIPTENGKINPGLKAGLQIGDSVLSVDGVSVNSAEDVQKVLNHVDVGKTVLVRVQRKGELVSVHVEPVKSTIDGQWKLGIWVKEKTAGLGTVTYYDPETGRIGALGHGITENNTGQILHVEQGQMMFSRVESVRQGSSGKPGEIRGLFYEADEPMGTLIYNSEFGIFGNSGKELSNPLYPEPLKVGYQSEVKTGKAQIMTTLDGNQIELYDIEIEKVRRQSRPDTKGMVIRVTDERLLKKSGGIVQGMSGSPILQGGKIIGAVTHVLVNDPSRGYGIFIEWMLKESNQVVE